MNTRPTRQKWSYQQITDATEFVIKRHLESAMKSDEYGARLYKNWATGALFVWTDLVALKLISATNSGLYDRFSADRARLEALVEQMTPPIAPTPAAPA